MVTKRILLTYVLIYTGSLTAIAQTNGSWLTEVNISNFNFMNSKSYTYYNSYTDKFENKGLNFSLNPGIGYFLTDKLVVGSTLRVMMYKSKATSFWYNGEKEHENYSSGTQIGASPFLRYYFTKKSKNRFYAQVSGGLNFDLYNKRYVKSFSYQGELVNSYSYPVNTQIGLSGEILLGFNHFINDNIAFNTSIGYGRTKDFEFASKLTSTLSSFPLHESYYRLNKISKLSWNLGFTIIISNKKKQP